VPRVTAGEGPLSGDAYLDDAWCVANRQWSYDIIAVYKKRTHAALYVVGEAYYLLGR
jgi:hypothetical protein